MATAAPTAGDDAGDPWIYGRSSDLLLGAGLGYMLLVPVLAIAGTFWSLDAWPTTVAALLALFVNAPHYGATVLRVYERREDRHRYALFAFWATLAILGLFGLGAHHLPTGSLLYTLYLSWAPWHFAGQNYGLALMFLRRRGIAVGEREKRLLYASFLLSSVLALLALHSAPAAPASPDGLVYRFLPLGIPAGAATVAFAVTGVAYLGCNALVGARLLGTAGVAGLAPSACLVVLQALWYVLPAAVRVYSGQPVRALAFTVLGISVAHSIQYLWVSSYYAKREHAGHRLGPYLLRALLAGLTVGILPGLLFAPGVLGVVPWNMGLAILLFSVVNLHHFVLDGAIWKLRDGRVARMLLREASPEGAAVPLPEHRRTWFRPAIAVLGAIALVVALTDLWQRTFVINRAGGDVVRLASGSAWLDRIGRGSPNVRNHVARAHAQRGNADAALAEYRRSVELYPTMAAWTGIARLEAERGNLQSAAEGLEAALALSPGHVPTLVAASDAWMRLGRAERAVALLERARANAPRNAAIARRLRNAAASTAGAPG